MQDALGGTSEPIAVHPFRGLDVIGEGQPPPEARMSQFVEPSDGRPSIAADRVSGNSGGEN